jgi:hypothetical protein
MKKAETRTAAFNLLLCIASRHGQLGQLEQIAEALLGAARRYGGFSLQSTPDAQCLAQKHSPETSHSSLHGDRRHEHMADVVAQAAHYVEQQSRSSALVSWLKRWSSAACMGPFLKLRIAIAPAPAG